MNYLLIYSFLILLIFILSGFSKIINIVETANGLYDKVKLNLPFNIYIIAIVIVIVLEILGPLLILYSSATNNLKKIAYYACIILTIFTIMATMIYHMPPTGNNKYSVLKNISIIGALLLLAEKFNSKD